MFRVEGPPFEMHSDPGKKNLIVNFEGVLLMGYQTHFLFDFFKRKLLSSFIVNRLFLSEELI